MVLSKKPRLKKFWKNKKFNDILIYQFKILCIVITTTVNINKILRSSPLFNRRLS